MTSEIVYYSLLLVLLLAVVGMLAANLRYLYASFIYRFEEGLACSSYALAGYVLFFLAKFQDVALPAAALRLLSNVLPDSLAPAAPAIPAALVGWLAGLYYARQARLGTLRSFRWVLLLVSLLHGILTDFFLTLLGSPRSPDKQIMTASATFVICIMLSWASAVRGAERGNLLDGLAGASSSHGSESPVDSSFTNPTTGDEDKTRFPF